MFNERSKKGMELLDGFETALDDFGLWYQITYKRPIPDIAKTLLNEVVGFVPEEEVKRSSLKPWEEG